MSSSALDLEHRITEEKGDLSKNNEATIVLPTVQLILVFCAFMLAFVLTALDQTIISTALPTIASHFQAVSDLSWIASAYFLPQAGLMLFFGKVLGIAPCKKVFLVEIAIFELGSLFCAISPSVNFLIFGRAVAGVGASGLMVSVMYIIAKVTSIRQRPIFIGIFGAVYAIVSIIGPLLGGVFSDHVSWRWCFYINLPIGGVALLAVAIILPGIPASDLSESHLKAWLSLDWIGVILSISMVVLLLIPIQWGGNVKPWNDPVVIALLVVAFVFIALFLGWEYRTGSKSILPLKIFTCRNMLGACIEAFFINICFILASYYLPFLYQLRGHSATRSGIDMIPFMISGTISALMSGVCISKLGYPWPFLFFGPLFASIASGLLYTLNDSSSTGKIIGFQIFLGVGLGVALQNTMVIAQAEFASDEAQLSVATSVMTFTQALGASVGIAAGGAIFQSRLKDQLLQIPGLDPQIIELALSNIKAISSLPAEDRSLISGAYIQSVDCVFLLSVAASILGSLASILIQRKKIELIAQ